MKKVIIIAGPTGVGKTKLSIDLAKVFSCEIINGDSVQVYKGLDIGSAKITNAEMHGVKHHLIDFLEPNLGYSVCDFQKDAREKIELIERPMIVGGTGLYIDAVIKNYDFSANRRNYEEEEKFEELTNEELFDYLKSLDEKASLMLHPNNRKRVLRAIALAKEGKSVSNKTNELVYDPLVFFLEIDRNTLYERINKRVDLMIEKGLIMEAKALYDKHIYCKAIGYQELNEFFSGRITQEEALELIKKNSRHLAKRQFTWFNNKIDSIKLDMSDYDKALEQAIKIIDRWI